MPTDPAALDGKAVLALPPGYGPAELPASLRTFITADLQSQADAPSRRMAKWRWWVRYMRYAMESLLWIKTQDAAIVPFRLNRIQRRILAKVMWDWQVLGVPGRYVIGPKPRRIGATTFVAGFNHIVTRFMRHRQSLVMANDAKTTEMIFRWHRTFEDRIIAAVKAELGENWKRTGRGHPLVVPLNSANMNMLQWMDFLPEVGEFTKEGGSYIRIATGGSAHGAVGDAFQLVHYSELGDDNVDWDAQTKANDRTVPDMWDDGRPAAGTFIFKEGATYLDDTSRVVTGVHLQHTVQAAVDGESDYYHFDIPWFDHERYRLPLEPGEKVPVFGKLPETQKRDREEQEDTRRRIWARWGIGSAVGEKRERLVAEMEAALNYRVKVLLPSLDGDFDWLHSQYPAYWQQAFVSRSRSFFDGVAINTRLESLPVVEVGHDQRLVVYREPEPGVEYIVPSDHSSGRGDDYAGAWAFNTKRLSIDAVWRGRVSVPKQAEELVDLCYRYATKSYTADQGLPQSVRPALWVPEANSYGSECIRIAREELHFDRIWRRKALDRSDASRSDEGRLGFWTDDNKTGGGARTKGLLQLSEQWQTWEIPDGRILRQMANFHPRKGSGKLEAVTGGDEFVTCGWIQAHVNAVLGVVKLGEWDDESWIEKAEADADPDAQLAHLSSIRDHIKAQADAGVEGAATKLARVDAKIAAIIVTRAAAVRQAEPWRAWWGRGIPKPNRDWRTKGMRRMVVER